MDLSIGSHIGVADLLAAIVVVAVIALFFGQRLSAELAVLFGLLAVAIIIVA